jgi:hypothetical protein
MKTPTARYFQPKEEYAEKHTQMDSPFNKFVVHCLHCGSFKLKVISEFDGDAGEAGIFLFCPSCRSREKLPAS